jgi:hypothetical protein
MSFAAYPSAFGNGPTLLKLDTKPSLKDPRYNHIERGLSIDEELSRLERYEEAKRHWFERMGAKVRRDVEQWGGAMLPMAGGPGHYSVLHPSTKKRGWYQVSFFDNEGPWGDTERSTLKEAIITALDRVAPETMVGG